MKTIGANSVKLCAMPLKMSRGSSVMNCIPAMLLLFLFFCFFFSLLHFKRYRYMTMMDSFCQYQIKFTSYCFIMFFTDMG